MSGVVSDKHDDTVVSDVQLYPPTERPGDYLVAIRVVECDRIDHVPVPLESQQLVARYGVPDLAGAVVASRDELVARLVECAIGER